MLPIALFVGLLCGLAIATFTFKFKVAFRNLKTPLRSKRKVLMIAPADAQGRASFALFAAYPENPFTLPLAFDVTWVTDMWQENPHVSPSGRAAIGSTLVPLALAEYDVALLHQATGKGTAFGVGMSQKDIVNALDAAKVPVVGLLQERSGGDSPMEGIAIQISESNVGKNLFNGTLTTLMGRK